MDIIIISCGKTETLKQLTQNSVNSCLNSIGEFNIIVIETCVNVRYKNCTTYYYQPKGRFNYNRALNYGISQCSGEYIACCNNDLIFDKNWSVNMLNAFDSTDFDSLSPFELVWHKEWSECKAVNKLMGDNNYIEAGEFVYPGNTVRVFFTGWCYVIKRSAYNKLIGYRKDNNNQSNIKITGFDELVEFYYSDNIVVEQYKKQNIKHGLVGNSLVKHLGEKTWRTTLCSSNQRYYTDGQKTKFNNTKRLLWST